MKIAKLKQTIIIVMTAMVMCLCLTVAGTSFAKASAADGSAAITAEQFKLKGTSVRYVDETYGAGVKFHVLLDKTVYNGLSDSAVTGVKLCPVSILNGESVKNSSNAAVIDKQANKNGWFESKTDSGMMELVVYVYDVTAKDYGTDLAVAGYITDNGTTTYTTEESTSLAIVAKTAAATETDEAKKAQLGGYYTFEVKLYNADKTLKESKTAEYGTILSKPEEEVCGWYNKDLTSQWNFETDKVKSNVALYAKAHGEVVYTSNGNGTHNKTYKCCGAVVAANEKCSYADGIDTSDEVYDYKKCVCGQLDTGHGFKKTVDLQDQQLVMTNEAIALDLTGVSAYDTVKSITLGGANLGTNLGSLELGAIKTDEKQHGAKQITVVVTDADGADHEVVVNATLVTKVITTDAELKDVLYEQSVAPTTNGETERFGYYVLGNDITYTGSRNYLKFMGTFDGNGKTISTSEMLNGLFTYALEGCIIKDLTIKATLSPLASNYRTVFANSCAKATFNNVAVIYAGGADSAELNGGGFLFGRDCTSSTFKNLTVNAIGKKIGSLLGPKMQNCKFIDSVVYADEVTCLAGKTDADKVGFADVEGIEHKQIQAKEVALWRQNPSLDYGDTFAGKTVAEITCGNYSLGNNLASLTITDELKADKQNHGNTTICVKFTDGSKVYLPVILVTAEISDRNGFIKTVQITNDNIGTPIFGYYTLKNDIEFGSDVSGANPGEKVKGKEFGFRGTFDGKGFTLKTIGEAKVYNGGFFGILGEGAVIKNVNFSANMAGAIGLIAHQGQAATIENVTIDFISAPTATRGGAMVGLFGGDMTYKDVTINAQGKDIICVFGVKLAYGAGGYKTTVPNCTNVVVNAKSVFCIGCKEGGIYKSGTTEPSNDHIAQPKGFTFNKTEA